MSSELQSVFGSMSTTAWLALAIGILIPFVYWFFTRNFDYWKKRAIPGPPARFFVGNYYDSKVPYPLLYQNYVKQYGNFVGTFEGQKPNLIISDPEVIKRIMVQDFHHFHNRNTNRGPSHRIMRLHLANSEYKDWRRIRSILTPMFTSAKLRKMESLMGACVNSLLDHLADKAKSGGEVDVRSVAGNFTMDVIAKCAFATDTHAHQTAGGKRNVFIDNVLDLFYFTNARFIALMFIPRWLQTWMMNHQVKPIYLNGFGFFENLSLHLIKQRRADKAAGRKVPQDMLQLMIDAEYNEKELSATLHRDLADQDSHHVNAGKEELEVEHRELQTRDGSRHLTEDEIMAQEMLFFLAGYETTGATLSYCLFELANNPEVQQKLYQEVQCIKQKDPNFGYTALAESDYLDAVLTETLRKYPPAVETSRVLNSDQYFIPEAKLTITRGQVVRFPVFAIHHDPNNFPKPEQFDPDRWMPANRANITPYTYLPFGGGPRNCIGMRFALTEAKLGLARMIDRFRVVPCAKTTEKLDIIPCITLLKTTPIFVGVQLRSK